MASYYWIKLYHEIIDDPKMALLPDRLWRRIVELFLLCGRHGKDGILPDTRQLAWELRMPPDELELDMRQIAATEIVTRINDGWVVNNFTKRQSPSSSTERSREFRKRKGNEDATQMQRNVAQNNRLTDNRLTDTDSNESINTTTTNGGGSSLDAEYSVVARHYERNIGPLTPIISEQIGDDLKQYGLTLCMDAIGEAARQNKRKWSYVQGVLKNWARDGRTVERSNGKARTREAVSITLPDGTVTEAMA